MAKRSGKSTHDQELSIEDLEQEVVATRKTLAGVKERFPEAQALAADDRRFTQGRLGLQESAVLRSVLDAAELEPALFLSLADEDEGHEPGRLETELIRDRLERHDLYTALADDLEALAKVFSDTALKLAAQSKPVTQAIYKIAKPISLHHPKLREKLAPALDYYGAQGKAAAVSRRANQAANK